MNRSMIGLLLLLSFSLLLLSGTAGMGLLSPATFGADDDGKNVTVRTGDTFWVKLPENPTTGYSWDLKLSDGLTKLSDTYEPADRSGFKVGVGGTHSYEIKATQKGLQKLTGSYMRPGDPASGALENYTLIVNVVDGSPLSGIFRLPAIITGRDSPLSAPDTSKTAGLLSGLSLPQFPAILNAGTSVPPLPAARMANAPREIKVTHTDVPPSDAVAARVGDTVRLELPENPSTGYSWQMTWSDGLEKVSDDYRQGSTGTAGRLLVGAPGTHEWVFKVTEAGPQKVTGVYKRPWESSSAGEKTYTLDVDAG
ncbi:MAG: Chagasin family peptidase inhibitor I42 [Methanocella sp. PtaU1.Bin125]|nr:MAG: Chagasin family peptidase inhibitor I42 [Methanocella sp. PtaU1.Bin125]